MQNQNSFKFFIVDDDVFCAKMHEQYLLNLNYSNIKCFSNGNDCLNNLNQNPDIIFLDHNMDGITGLEVLKKIKRYNPSIYVIMVSGQQNIKIAVDAHEYDAYDYIIKDNLVYDKMTFIINKISSVKEAMKKSTSTFIEISKNSFLDPSLE
ncbi:Response regulator receiver domain-containing protein [Flavobacterium omnivorum]|uniref:Response regulator receiver domain-containing protein n=1 Tax=Flavobacterium omnivorum TaxID=178355 RepID=A0A1G8EGT2_9FLAO|nr:response regulator [Flavobacterium omnivorum]SDH69143.1 Response regulator receiver domain-containing protein [Flavobacterium omnivorum]